MLHLGTFSKSPKVLSQITKSTNPYLAICAAAAPPRLIPWAASLPFVYNFAHFATTQASLLIRFIVGFPVDLLKPL
jgi:hypothetical protein